MDGEDSKGGEFLFVERAGEVKGTSVSLMVESNQIASHFVKRECIIMLQKSSTQLPNFLLLAL